MRSFRLAPVFALLCVSALSLLAGCGGSDDGTPSVSPSPSGSPAADRSIFAGRYQGSWRVETEPDSAVFERVTINGPATITVTDDGTFTAVLENDTPYTYGVFTENNKTHTLRGTIRESGFFDASVTTRETIRGEVVETTDTVSGSLVEPLDGGDQYRGTIGLTHAQVEISGVLDVFKN